MVTTDEHQVYCKGVNPMCTLKLQSNGPLYSSMMTGILATDGWAVTFGKCEEKPERAAAPPSPLLTLPNVTGHPSTTSVPTSHHSMWQYNYLRTLKG